MADRREALAAFLKTAKDSREILKLLGLQRRQRPVKDLSDYIKEQAN